MARPKKKITIDFDTIDAAPTGTVHKLATYATQAGVSGPTMRSRIADHYGDRVTFKQGRNGGFTVAQPQEIVEETVQENADDSTPAPA